MSNFKFLQRQIALLALFFSIVHLNSFAQEKLMVFPDSTYGEVSGLLFGMNLSFEHDRDSLRANPLYVENLKGVKAGILRYPGGSKTSYYHWEYPGSPLRKDIYHPEAQDSTSKFFTGEGYLTNVSHLDTDEYIALCREVGAEPLLGINIKSGLKFDRVEDGLEEAKRWVQYCKDKDYQVKYWYLDNEVNHFKHASTHPITLEKYAEQIKLFSPAIKGIDPEAKVVVNIMADFDDEKNAKLIDLAGDHFDVIDVHYYWAWGKANWDKWVQDNPMSDKPEEVEAFYKMVKSKGKDIELACLEYNIPPHNTEEVIHSDYQHALMQTELFQQFLSSKLHAACMWPYLIDSKSYHRSIVSQKDHYTKMPFYYMMETYTEAIDGQKVKLKSSDEKIRAFAVKKEGKLLVYLINKNPSATQLNIADCGKPIKNACIGISQPEGDGTSINKEKMSMKKLKGGGISMKLAPFTFYALQFEVPN